MRARYVQRQQQETVPPFSSVPNPPVLLQRRQPSGWQFSLYLIDFHVGLFFFVHSENNTFSHFSFLFFVDIVETYRSPVETICTNIDYYIPDNKGDTKSFSEDAMARLRKHCPFSITAVARKLRPAVSIKKMFIVLDMGRAMIALFIVSFFFDFVAFWTGVVGCWRRGAGNITSTAILMLLACKFSLGRHHRHRYYYRFSLAFLFAASLFIVWLVRLRWRVNSPDERRSLIVSLFHLKTRD